MARRKCVDIEDAKQLVRERLEFVEIISALNEQFCDDSLIRELPPDGWIHPWKYFESLRNYLLLTCFDALGQQAPFLPFNSWLEAKPTKAEREQIFEAAAMGIHDTESLVSAVKLIHREYLTLYGTKNSFYWFINEVLDIQTRAKLLSSVMIEKVHNLTHTYETVDAPQEKVKFLFYIRNSYTHHAMDTGFGAGAVFPELYGKPIMIHGKLQLGYCPILREQKGDHRITYLVRDWPNVLKEAVTVGLNLLTG